MDDKDYTDLSGPELIAACGDNAAAWAVAFQQHATALGYPDIMDEGWLIGWFANAIEAACDLRQRQSQRLERAAEPAIHNVIADERERC